MFSLMLQYSYNKTLIGAKRCDINKNKSIPVEAERNYVFLGKITSLETF